MEGMGDLNGTEDNEAEAPHLKRKECDHSSQPDNRNMMESTGTFISSDNDWPDPLSSSRSPEVFTETLEGQVLVRCGDSKAGAEWPPTSPCNVDDPSVTVEELRLKNYNGSNLSIVGCSNSRDKMPMRRGQWQHLYQLAGGSGNMNSCGEDVGNIFLPKSCNEKPLVGKYPAEYHAEVSEHLINNDNCTVSSEAFTGFPGGIRTKVLPAFGFSQFFVKNTLKGKGVLYRHPGTREGCGVVIQGQNKDQGVTRITCDKSQGCAKADDLSRYCGPGVRTGSSADADLANDGVSIREWLNQRSGKINKAKNLHLFQHILEVVDIAHSQGVVLSDIRPSCFLVLPSDKVKYVGSWGPQIRTELSGSAGDQDAHHVEHHFRRKRQLEQGLHGSTVLSDKQQKLSEHMNFVGHHPAVSARCGLNHETFKEDHISSLRSRTSGCEIREQKNLDKGHPIQDIWASHRVSSLSQPRSGYESIQLEERWYASPEELKDGVCKLSSNIYSLGVLLFELLYCFESWEVHATAMSDLRHRVLPPNFLSENPKEAGFCLWLLHPEPSSRPKTREILQSDLICEARNLSSGDQSPLSVGEEDAESELLLHFLITLKEQKQTQASKLVEDVGCLDADIEEVEKRHSLRTELLSRMYQCPSTKDTSAIFHNVSDECILNGPLQPSTLSRSSVSWNDEMRLMRNINQLENAYFSMRSKINLPETDAAVRADMGVLKSQHRWTPVQNDDEWCMNKKPVDCLGSFFDGICKYARYSKFEVRGTLRNEDILNSANVICSLSFDRDEEYFAAAGVSKKIKIFEFGSLLNDMVDIHYPVVEMSSKSKLSCVCWNNYIKNYLASTDYDGVVQLWDASTGQGFSQYAEHQKRAWSVDFSQLDPTKLASGSDDCSVKLWSINEESCISTIRNVANICCVQFSSYSPHVLAFGSADYKIYCYDLRNTRIPWCTLTGHGKAVSYVKFLDPVTLVSASTDNTLKLWDLKKTSSSGFSPSACSLTLSGHTNEKNFVGLSVSDGYISCGSETNEVYAYYKSLPMPITSHKFGSIDAITGQETGDDNGQFVSSVCWRGKENIVVAANSNGSIKLLQFV